MKCSEPDEEEFPSVMGKGNGLMETIFRAYAQEMNILLRPEDVWYTIVSQIGFYAKSHGQAMRKFLVNHDRVKTLKATSTEAQDVERIKARMDSLLDPRLWLIDYDNTKIAQKMAEQDEKDLEPFIDEALRIEMLRGRETMTEEIRELIEANSLARELKLQERREERLRQQEFNEKFSQLRLELSKASAQKLRQSILDGELEEATKGMGKCADMIKVFNSFDKQLKDSMSPEMQEWMTTSFTTSRDSDKIIAPVLLMGTAQAYHNYKIESKCGIACCTLDGELSDWQQLVDKLTMLPAFGEEPALFARLLEPILKNFVRFYANPHAEDIRHYWSTCITNSFEWADWREEPKVGPWISGWLGAFRMWDENGLCLYNSDGWRTPWVTYPKFPAGDFPPAWTSIPFTITKQLEDSYTDIHGFMVAGCVGSKVNEIDDPNDVEQYDEQIQPFHMWWMLEADSDYVDDPQFEAMVDGDIWHLRGPRAEPLS
ncbi:hypothetical protein N7495_006311 [Penicillium taxi]|uniref:uncharacterized protein n=1 Tax=Penicillium taxi TaxID=168475 RepID=UPI002544FF38|nr:uncharacterized protein N7495_006311 [Penicillium taxi]KAJ5894620.1 hypothetical protein N7495_006311 [Penicillium taxi]